MADDEARDQFSNQIRIGRLPHHAATKIVATSIILDLQTAVLGLIKNALDAGATRISVTCNPARSSCEVQDDGHGIPAREFGADGGLGKAHHTSKRTATHKPEVSSSDGIFLSSLASVSLLRMLSKTSDDQHSSAMTIHQGDVLERSLHSSERDDVRLERCGTIITADDIFGNVPVRLKQRWLASDTHRHDEACWEDIKHRTVALLLAWRMPCIVRLRDVLDSRRTIMLTPSHPATSHALTSSALHGNGTAYTLKHKLVLLQQAKLCSSISQKDWIALSATTSSAKVKGFVCLQPSSNKSCQFISIGVKPVEHGEEAGELYDTVNRIFDNSSFGVEDERRLGNNVEQLRREGGASKNADRYPMFILAIDMLPAQDQNRVGVFNRGKVADQLSPLIVKVIKKWLASHGFRIRQNRSRLRSNRNVDSLDTQQPSKSHSTRLKSSDGKLSDQSQDPEQVTFNLQSSLQQPQDSDRQDLQPWTRIKQSKGIANSANHGTLPNNVSQAIVWPFGKATAESSRSFAEPLRSQSFSAQITPETHSGPPLQYVSHDERTHVHSQHAPTPHNLTFEQANRDSPLPERLRDWEAPLLAPPAEPPIPVSLPEIDDTCLDRNRFPGSRGSRLDSTTASSHKLSRNDIARALVIRQVDAKFILCRTTGTNGSLLFVIDQHAASERIILESLLQDFLLPTSAVGQSAQITTLDSVPPVVTSYLDKPITFQTTNQEYDAFKNRTTDFAAWGIVYDAMMGGVSSHSSQAYLAEAEHRIIVKALPAVIAERCRLAPRLLIDLMRSEVWELANRHESTTDVGLSSTEQPAWLSRIHRCPKRILDMINSRACRSAVMFNDVLSRNECTELVTQLSTTVFPFMCAHGRTSVVPLYRLEANTTIDPSSQRSALGAGHIFERSRQASGSASNYSSAFTEWMERTANE